MPILGRWPKALVAHVHARHLAQCLVGGEHATLLQRFAVHDLAGAGQAIEPVGATDDV